MESCTSLSPVSVVNVNVSPLLLFGTEISKPHALTMLPSESKTTFSFALPLFCSSTYACGGSMGGFWESSGVVSTMESV